MTEIQVNYQSGFNQTDIERANRAIELLKIAVNSNDFKDRVRKIKSFRRNKIKSKTGNKRYSNEEILNLILSGEDLRNPPDNVINLNLNLYESERNEIGHTTIPDNETLPIEIHTYRGYFDKDIKKYASHLMHEYMHVVGFRHEKYDIFKKRYKTVPYRIGRVMYKTLTNL